MLHRKIFIIFFSDVKKEKFFDLFFIFLEMFFAENKMFIVKFFCF